MILRYAARNLARHRTRTALTTSAVVLAVGLIIVANTILDGMNQHVFQQFTIETGHVRLQNPDYARESRFKPLDYTIMGLRERQQTLEALEAVDHVQARIRFAMMVQHTDTSTIVDDDSIPEDDLTDEQIFGRKVLEFGPAVAVQPSREAAGLADKVVKGSYFTGEDAQEVLVGVEMARRLGVEPGDELELLTNRDGIRDMGARVVGIFDFGHRLSNRSCYVPLARAETLLDLPDQATELLVFGHDFNLSAQLLAEVTASPAAAGLTAEKWQDIGLMQTVSTLFDGILGLLLVAILLVAGAGLLNTMLMSVLERQKEIGVLLALGLGRAKVVGAIVSEAALFALVGSVVGVLLGLAVAWPIVHSGIHLGVDASAAMPVPISETIHGEITGVAIVRAALIGVVVAILGALGPALSATRVNPVEAMGR